MRRSSFVPLILLMGCQTIKPTIQANLPVRAVTAEEESSSRTTASSSGDVHWIEADEYFVSDKALDSSWIYVQRGRMSRPAGANGDAAFTLVRDAQELITRHYWRAHPAQPSELAVGRKVVVFEGRLDSEESYLAPSSKDEMVSGGWFLATVADLSDLNRDVVRLSGGYKARVAALRVVEGDEAQPAIASSAGREDEHWITPDDFFIADRNLGKSFMYVKLAKRLEAPTTATKNQGKYFVPVDGKTTFTAYGWQTRKASKGELNIGTPVVCFEGQQGSDEAYTAPKSKDASRTGTWFMAKVTDRSDFYRGFVTVSDGYKCRLENVRLAVKQ
jgi:hypothetical protein